MEDRYLFKAKRIDNGEWVQGNLIQSCDATDGWETIIIPIKNSNMFTKHIKCGYGNLGFENWYRVDPSTICQCTGLKDKNGKLIWENDIVKKGFYIDYDSVYQEEHVTSVISKEYVGTVKFECFAWIVETFNDQIKCILPIYELSEHSEDIKYFEVVGNIFDNPELGEG